MRPQSLNSPKLFNTKSRLKWVFLFFLLPIFVIGRLFQLQTFRHEAYTSMSERSIYSWTDSDRVRGKILDRNGRELADSVRTHSCAISKRNVKNKEKLIDFLSQALDISKGEIENRWKLTDNFFFVSKNMKPEEYIKIASIKKTPLGEGVELSAEYERIHPYGDLALDILGLSNSKNIGLSGIEKMYDKELSYDISKKRAKHARRGEIIYDRTLKTKISVANIYLTIDVVAQHYAEEALTRAVEEAGALRGILIVEEPSTGEILAAASYPKKDGQSLAFQFTYEPGSTFKSISLSSALDKGVVSASDSIDMEGRKWEVARGFVLKDEQHEKDYLTIPEIMQLSSNIGAGKIALELGEKNLFTYIKHFGFGSKTDVNFIGESKGSVAPYNLWTKVDLVSKGFGYGVQLTPIQLVNAYSAIANGGYLMQPHLIEKIEYTNGKKENLARPIKIRRVLKKETSDTMKKILQSVVEEGSGRKAKIEGYQIAGKTGTAEKAAKKGYENRKHIVSFCGFVPLENPEFTILIILDEPAKRTFGGTTAAPVFKEVATKLLSLKGITPDNPNFEVHN